MRPPDDLTPRERDVLSLVRAGLTNEEIAQRLEITLDGAKYHVSQILSKLGVATREEAAAVALGAQSRWYWKLAWIGGAGVTAVALAGIGALAWGVAQTSQRNSDVCGSPGDLAAAEVDEDTLSHLKNLHPAGSAGFIFGEAGGDWTSVDIGALPPITLDEAHNLIAAEQVVQIEIGDISDPKPDHSLYSYRDSSGEPRIWPIVAEYVLVVTRETLESQSGSDTIWLYGHPILCETGQSVGLSPGSVESLLRQVDEHNSHEGRAPIEVHDGRGRLTGWTPGPPP